MNKRRIWNVFRYAEKEKVSKWYKNKFKNRNLVEKKTKENEQR